MTNADRVSEPSKSCPYAPAEHPFAAESKGFLWPRVISLPFLNLYVYLPVGREHRQEVLSHFSLTAGPLPFIPSVNEKKTQGRRCANTRKYLSYVRLPAES